MTSSVSDLLTGVSAMSEPTRFKQQGFAMIDAASELTQFKQGFAMIDAASEQTPNNYVMSMLV